METKLTPETSPIEPLLMSVPHTAHVIGCSESKTWLLISDGTLDSVKIGTRRMVKVASARALAERGTAAPEEA